MTHPRHHAGILAAADRAGSALELFTRASAGLRRLVPFDAAVWTATDPETGLVTAPMLVEGLGPRERCAAYWESELLEENVLPFRDLARAAVPVAGLRAATGDLPARSVRFRRVLGDQGVDDELRAVLRTGDRPWGVVSLFRMRGGGPAFGQDDVTLVAGLSGPLADRLRRFARPYGPAGEPGAAAPGLLLFDEHGTATSINDEARSHLARLPDGPSSPSALGVRLPIWLVGTALQARAIAQGRDRGSATTRIRTADGQWLTCRASCLNGPGGRPGPTALVIEPAAPADLAVIVAQSYGLTPREYEVARLVARGLPTAEIATALFISPHTVRGHLKAVFGKTGIGSRGELVAHLFARTVAT